MKPAQRRTINSILRIRRNKRNANAILHNVMTELVTLVKGMKFGTECGADFMVMNGEENCTGCKHFHFCKGAQEHQELCDKLLKKLNDNRPK